MRPDEISEADPGSDPDGTGTTAIHTPTGESWRQAQKVISLLKARWTPAILGQLWESGSRYQELYEAINGVSYKVLTETLRRMQHEGLVVRRLDECRVETATLYELTNLARSLDAPLAAMADWESVYWQEVEAARRRWDVLRRRSR